MTGPVSANEATADYRARFDESTPAGILRTSSLLRWAQDVAWIHSERLGFGREWYVERGLAWVVRGLELAILGSIRTGETMRVRTVVTGFRKVWARRRTEFARLDGTLVVWAHTDWVMTDARGMPTRVPATFPALFDVSPAGFEPTRVALPPTPADAARASFTVRRQDLDPMAHANNAAYVDYLEELLAAVAPDTIESLPRTLRLEYLLPLPPEAAIVGSAWALPDDVGWAYRLSDESGSERFRAVLSVP